MGCGAAGAIFNLKQDFQEKGLEPASCSIQAAWEGPGAPACPAPSSPIYQRPLCGCT